MPAESTEGGISAHPVSAEQATIGKEISSTNPGKTPSENLGVEFRADVGGHGLTFRESTSVFGVKSKTKMTTGGFSFDGEAAYTFSGFPLRAQLGFTTFQSSTDTEKVTVGGVRTQTVSVQPPPGPGFGYEIDSEKVEEITEI